MHFPFILAETPILFPLVPACLYTLLSLFSTFPDALNSSPEVFKIFLLYLSSLWPRHLTWVPLIYPDSTWTSFLSFWGHVSTSLNSGGAEKYVGVVQDMCEICETVMRCAAGVTELKLHAVPPPPWILWVFAEGMTASPKPKEKFCMRSNSCRDCGGIAAPVLPWSLAISL